MISRSVCEDLSPLREHSVGEEEDPHQEAESQPRLQRILHLRPAEQGRGPGGGPAGGHHVRLGQDHQE